MQGHKLNRFINTLVSLIRLANRFALRQHFMNGVKLVVRSTQPEWLLSSNFSGRLGTKQTFM